MTQPTNVPWLEQFEECLLRLKPELTAAETALIASQRYTTDAHLDSPLAAEIYAALSACTPPMIDRRAPSND